MLDFLTAPTKSPRPSIARSGPRRIDWSGTRSIDERPHCLYSSRSDQTSLLDHTTLMVTEPNRHPKTSYTGTTSERDTFARDVLERVTSKWPLKVLQVVAETDQPLRFSRVLEQVDGISQKMLSQTLRTLEREGLVTRTVFAQIPPRVEYEATKLGRDLLGEIVPVCRWIAARESAFVAARATFSYPMKPGES
ncbi:winged helix-turn-helix transcriptional regulator [Paraburkholderia sp. 40]|uniref:winged helix-turn-helix transcriptional regulator n=1 Tax=Paraburkholderia sp. 40 TaxID=2991059 RepID=UPI003D1A4F92